MPKNDLQLHEVKEYIIKINYGDIESLLLKIIATSNCEAITLALSKSYNKHKGDVYEAQVLSINNISVEYIFDKFNNLPDYQGQ